MIWTPVVCKIPFLARALGLKAARPSTRATIAYRVSCMQGRLSLSKILGLILKHVVLHCPFRAAGL